MSWILFSLVSMFGWGFADLFYKKSSDEEDKSAYLKIAIWVGTVMGITSVFLTLFTETGFSFSKLIKNAFLYSPAAVGYIASMVIGYAGLRYLEISIISPVQNASGAFSAVAMATYFLATGKMTGIFNEFSSYEIIGTVIIIVGVISLTFVQKGLENSQTNADKKYKIGALALIFPILYCAFDTLGTAADGIILDGDNGLGLSEIDVLIVYGFTFFAVAVVMWFVLLIKDKKAYNPFCISELKTKGAAGLFEEAGQIAYVYAMAKNPVVAAPMIASYCIVSVLLSAVFLKEKLTKKQYLCIALVIIGIVLLGIGEGISEM